MTSLPPPTLFPQISEQDPFFFLLHPPNSPNFFDAAEPPSNPPLPSSTEHRKKIERGQALFQLLSKAGIIKRITPSRSSACVSEDSEGTYRCSKCPQKSFSSEKIKRHLRTVHGKSDKCLLCGKVCHLYGGISHALSSHSSHPKVRQIVQQLSAKKTSQFDLHPFVQQKILYRTRASPTDASIVAKEDRFSCSKCPRISLRQKHGVLTHIMSHHRGVKEICDICGKTLIYSSGIKHVNYVHAKEERVIRALRRSVAVESESIDVELPSLLLRDRIIQQTETEDLCTICNAHFLLNHGAAHVWEKHRQDERVLQMQCNLPKPRVPRPAQAHLYFGANLLRRVTPAHTNAKPVPGTEKAFACSKCRKQYKRRSSAAHHIAKRHQKIQDVCLLCNKRLQYGGGVAHIDRCHTEEGKSAREAFS